MASRRRPADGAVVAESGTARSLPDRTAGRSARPRDCRRTGAWAAAPWRRGPRRSRRSGPLAGPRGRARRACRGRASSAPVLHEALAAVRAGASRPTADPPPGNHARDRRPVEPGPRDRAAAGADGRGGHPAAGGRPGEHLPLGPAQPLPRRPAGPGHPRTASCGSPTIGAWWAR